MASLVKYAPFPLVYAATSFVFGRYRRRAVWNPVVNPEVHWEMLSGSTREAINRLGGTGTVSQQLAWTEDNAIPVAAALLIKGSRAWATRVSVTVDGQATDVQSLAQHLSGPVILVQPHLGSSLLAPGLLALACNRQLLSLIDTLTAPRLRLYSALSSFTGVDLSQRIRFVVAANPFIWKTVDSHLRSGGVFVWQPDVFGGASRTSTEQLHVVDVPVRRSPPPLGRLADRRDTRIVVAGERIADGTATLSFRTIPTEGLPEAELLEHVYAAANSAILESIDQWSRWKAYPAL